MQKKLQEKAARLPPIEEVRTVLDHSLRGVLSTFSQVPALHHHLEYGFSLFFKERKINFSHLYKIPGQFFTLLIMSCGVIYSFEQRESWLLLESGCFNFYYLSFPRFNHITIAM